MASSDKVKALVEKIPEPDPDVNEIIKKAGLDKKASNREVMEAVRKERPDLALLRVYPRQGKVTGPVWDDALKIIEPILAEGKGGIAAVLDMLKEVDDGQDYKARYVLHIIAQYVCRSDKQEQQDMVIDALASALDGRPKPIQRFILQQLQVCGDGRATAKIGKLLLDDDVCEEAALALVAIGKGAVEQFRAALGKASGKARLNVVQNLGVLRDADSLRALRNLVGDSDAAVRIAAAWGLANLGDTGSFDLLLRAADERTDWERIQATKACLMLAEKALADGKKDVAARIYKHLSETRKDASESYIREAAAKALAAMQ